MNEETKRKKEERLLKIQELAYYKWQNAGSPMGRCMEFWLAAEKEIEQEEKHCQFD